MFNRSIFSQMPPVTKNLLIVNVIIFLAMAIFPDKIGVMMNRHCGLHYYLSQDFIFTQFISYQFVHANFGHLFFNMFALFMFGMVIESIFGPKRFLTYYLICGIGAGLIQMGVNAIELHLLTQQLVEANHPIDIQNGTVWIMNNVDYSQYTDIIYNINALINAPTVGASGAIFGILLAYGKFFPNREMYIMFIPYPVKAKWVVIGYAVIELVQGVGLANTGIAHFAHLGGMIFGLLLILYWQKTGVIRRNGGYF